MPNNLEVTPEGKIYCPVDQLGMNHATIYNIIAHRFHNCMKEESQKMAKEDLEKLNDWELVHSVCAYDRLTLFNYLRIMNPNNSDQKIKTLIMTEYEFYFKRPGMDITVGATQRIKNILDIKLL